ncbi:MAG: sigma-70 family RNA polymerase sigma factor [Planctomycetota bacterium]
MDHVPSLPGHEALLEHAAWVRRLAAELVRDAAAAEDVAQETWLAYLRLRPGADRPLRPWLARVVRNQAALRARRASARLGRELDAARSEAVPSADELVGRAEVQRRVVEAVLALHEPYRGALLLRYYEGLTPKEIAQARGLNGATVRSHLARGLALLRAELDALHGGDRRAWAALLVPLALPVRLAARPLIATAAWGVVVCAVAVFVALNARHRAEPRQALAPQVAGPAGASTDASSALRVPSESARSRAAPGDLAAVGGGAATRRVRLVDAAGAPLAQYTLCAPGPTPLPQGAPAEGASVGRWTSDDSGIVTLPRDLAAVVPIDDDRLAFDALVEHGARQRQRLVRAPVEVAAPDAEGLLGDGSTPTQWRPPCGPTMRLRIDAPAAIDLDELEARLVSTGLSEYRDDGNERPIAPIRRPTRAAQHAGVSGPATAIAELPWVRFGVTPKGADDPRATWRLEVRDRAGYWFGAVELDALDAHSAHPVDVRLSPSGVVAGSIDVGAEGPPTDVLLALYIGHVDDVGGMSARAPFVAWTALDAEGRFELRWVPPGAYTLGTTSARHATAEHQLEVVAGERCQVELALAPLVTVGRLAGEVRSESGAYSGQLLVFLRDASGSVIDVVPTTWRPRGDPDADLRAAFEFTSVPAGALSMDVVSFTSAVTAEVEPTALRAPSGTVLVTLRDTQPAADVEFEVVDAISGAVISALVVEATIDGGLPRRFARWVDEDGRAGWSLTAGGMLWNRFIGAAPLRRLPDAALLEWTVTARGYTAHTGGRSELVAVAEGRFVARVALRAE